MSTNVKNLTREEKLKLIQLIEEKKRRELIAKPKYVPTPKQLNVIQSPADERFLFCANGFGKSALLVNELHWYATGYNEITKTYSQVPAKIILLLDNPTKVDDVINEYRKWHALPDEYLSKRGKPHISYFRYPNGSTVQILTHDVQPLKLEGIQFTHLLMDEPPSKDVFTGLYRGGRIKGSPLKVLFCGTPISASWLRTDVFEPWNKGELPHVECFNGTTYDNAANLQEGYIERFSAYLSEDEKKIRLHGQFFDLAGLALAHLFNKNTHLVDVKEWDREWPCVIAIDPHPAKPHHAVILGSDKKGNLVVLDEYAEKVLARKFMETIISTKGWFGKYKIIDIVYDSLGNTETSSGEGFKSFGVIINEVLASKRLGRARATTFNDKSDGDFIGRIQDSLMIKPGEEKPKLQVASHCVGLIRDIENVGWQKNKFTKETRPVLDISNTDYLSCLKYALATNLYFKKAKEKAYLLKRPPYKVR